MVQTLPANPADQPFYIRALPRRTRRGEHLLDTHHFHLLHKILSEDLVAIPQQVPRCAVRGKCFSKLLHDPFRRRVLRYANERYADARAPAPERRIGQTGWSVT